MPDQLTASIKLANVMIAVMLALAAANEKLRDGPGQVAADLKAALRSALAELEKV